jgi:hypothetical protein
MERLGSRVTLLMFPREDAQFRALVESLKGTTGIVADHLQQQLRSSYPHAVVRQRDPLGELDPAAETWYVYRDGSLFPRTSDQYEHAGSGPADAPAPGAG